MRMKRQLLIVGVLIICVINFSGCTEQSTNQGVGINELFESHYLPETVVNFKETVSQVKTFHTSYGQFSIISTQYTYIDSAKTTDRISLYVGNNEEYKIGDKIEKTLHIKEYQFNQHKIISPEEMFGLYLIFPITIGKALDSTSYVAGFSLVLKSIDEKGKTQYEVNSNGSSFSLNELHAQLLKIKLETAGETFNYNITSSINLFALEYVTITGNYSNLENIDSINPLENKKSPNNYLEYVDTNSNGLLDDNDVFYTTLLPTEDKYTIDTYLLVIGENEISSLNDIIGIKYIINWYKGVYSQEDEL